MSSRIDYPSPLRSSRCRTSCAKILMLPAAIFVGHFDWNCGIVSAAAFALGGRWIPGKWPSCKGIPLRRGMRFGRWFGRSRFEASAAGNLLACISFLWGKSSMENVFGRQDFSTTDSVSHSAIQHAPLGRTDMLAKRVCDVALAATILVLLSPLMLLVSLIIKLESTGPIIFRQRRVGFNGRDFTIYKFRTMSVLEDGRQISQTRRNDPRITKVGGVLRQSSIDELPQLFNVIKGEMSLVGPRPHAVAHDDQYQALISSYAFRRQVKPGLTGWAQINGRRGETRQIQDMERRIELDLWYIDNWSLSLDFKILWGSCFEVLRLSAY
jgi:exopolysaccharide biosynthesis polyprenyl glycosylphosphotransferase